MSLGVLEPRESLVRDYQLEEDDRAPGTYNSDDR